MNMFTVEFIDPNSRLEGQEFRSKLLKPGSNLFNVIVHQLTDYQNQFPQLVSDPRMGPHIELISVKQVPKEQGEKLEDGKILVELAQKMQGTTTVDVQLFRTKKAVFIKTPNDTHATVAFFPSGVPEELHSDITYEELP